MMCLGVCLLGPTSLGPSVLPGLLGSLFPSPDWGNFPSLCFQLSFLLLAVIPQMKEQSISWERELSDEEIANLSDGEFKALKTEMLTELIELGRQMKEQMKDTQN